RSRLAAAASPAALAAPAPSSALFPYTTLFRSHHGRDARRCWRAPGVHPVGALPSAAAAGQRRCLCHRQSASARGRRSPSGADRIDRKSTRLNSSHVSISYAVFCLKKKKSCSRSRLTTETYLGSGTLDRLRAARNCRGRHTTRIRRFFL